MSQRVRANFDLQVDNMLPFHQLIVIKCSLYASPPGQSHLSLPSPCAIDPAGVPASSDFIRLAAVNYSTV